MKLPEIYKEDNCLYLVQDISGMDLYDRSKAIVSFCDKETKLFEKEIDRAILEIFTKNGINISSTDKSVLKKALDLLKRNNKQIEIVDLYKYNGEVIDSEKYQIVKVKETKNHFTVLIETEWISGIKTETLQCGVMIIEKEIK